MKLEGEENLRESVKLTIDLLKKKDVKGDVFGYLGKSFSHTIKEGKVFDSTLNEENGIAVRIIKNNKIGFAYSVPGNEEEAINRAMELSSFSDKTDLSLPEEKDKNEVDLFDQSLFELIVDQESPGLNQALGLIVGVKSRSKKVRAAYGGINLGVGEKMIGNTNGVFFQERKTQMSGSVSAELNRDKSGLTASESVVAREKISDINNIGKKAADKALSLREQSKIAPGKKSVAFSPDAFARLLSDALLPAFYGKNVRKGRSVYQNKKGEQVTSQDFSLIEDPTREMKVGSTSFDDEGFVTEKKDFIKEGKLNRFVYDLKESVKRDQGSPGNGYRGGFRSPPSIGTSNLILKDSSSLSLEEIKSQADVYIDSLMGSHTADPVSSEFSVVINPGWSLKNGEKQGRLDQAMLAGSLASLLEKIKLADNYRQVSVGHSFVLPTVLLEGVPLTA